MKALDTQMIDAFIKATIRCAGDVPVSEVRPTHAFRTEKYVTLTNRSILISWPNELVDSDTEDLKRLIRKSSNVEFVQELIKQDWRKRLLPEYKKNIYDCTELDPENAVTMFKASDSRMFSYNTNYIDLIEYVFPFLNIDGEPHETKSYQIYAQHLSKNGWLVVSEGGKRRAILANIT